MDQLRLKRIYYFDWEHNLAFRFGNEAFFLDGRNQWREANPVVISVEGRLMSQADFDAILQHHGVAPPPRLIALRNAAIFEPGLAPRDAKSRISTSSPTVRRTWSLPGRILLGGYIAGYFAYVAAAALAAWSEMSFLEWWRYIGYQAFYGSFWPIILLVQRLF